MLRFKIMLTEAVAVACLNDGGLSEVEDVTLEGYRVAMRSLMQVVGDVDIGGVTARDILKWQKQLQKQDFQPTTINNYQARLSAVFQRLVDKHLLSDNPIKYVKRLPEPQLDPAAISKKNFKRLIALCDRRNEAVLRLLLDTGMRISELCNLKQTDVIFELHKGKYRCTIKVLGKGAKYRTVYAMHKAAKSLNHYLQMRRRVDHDYLFVSKRGTRLKKPAVQQMLVRLSKSAGISPDEPTNPHSFRHAAAIRWLRAGYDARFVADMLGHSDVTTTLQTYLRRTEAQTKELYFDSSHQEKVNKWS